MFSLLQSSLPLSLKRLQLNRKHIKDLPTFPDIVLIKNVTMSLLNSYPSSSIESILMVPTEAGAYGFENVSPPRTNQTRYSTTLATNIE
jgi:hypothetical protein